MKNYVDSIVYDNIQKYINSVEVEEMLMEDVYMDSYYILTYLTEK